jgi:hypothetical protein
VDERHRDDFPNNFVGVRRDVTGQREPDRASHFQSVDRGALSLLGRPDSSFPVALFSADRQSVGGGISRVVDYSRHVRVALRRLTSAKKLGGFGRCPHRRCRRAKLRAYQYIPARLQLLCCPDGHAYSDPGWSVSAVRCTCNGRHMCPIVGARHRDHEADRGLPGGDSTASPF